MRTYSEAEFATFAAELVDEMRKKSAKGRPRLILAGPLGAGKSTLARAVLAALGVRREAEGSPTFALAHEYVSSEGRRVVHADGYRLKSEEDLEVTGLLETLWDGEAFVLFEWLDLFPETMAALKKSDLPAIWIRLAFASEESKREIEVERTER